MPNLISKSQYNAEFDSQLLFREDQSDRSFDLQKILSKCRWSLSELWSHFMGEALQIIDLGIHFGNKKCAFRNSIWNYIVKLEKYDFIFE